MMYLIDVMDTVV